MMDTGGPEVNNVVRPCFSLNTKGIFQKNNAQKITFKNRTYFHLIVRTEEKFLVKSHGIEISSRGFDARIRVYS